MSNQELCISVRILVTLNKKKILLRSKERILFLLGQVLLAISFCLGWDLMKVFNLMCLTCGWDLLAISFVLHFISKSGLFLFKWILIT